MPFVHLPSLQPPNENWDVSDLRVVPLNRSLNERMSVQADLIRSHVDLPVVFKGVADHTYLAHCSVSACIDTTGMSHRIHAPPRKAVSRQGGGQCEGSVRCLGNSSVITTRSPRS